MRRASRSWMGLTILWAASLAAGAQDRPPQDAPWAVQSVAENIGAVFSVSANLAVDPALRAAAKTMAEGHRDHLTRLAERWYGEMRVQDATLTETQLAQRLFVRFANELTLWSLVTAGPAHDTLLWQAAADPGACDLVRHFNHFEKRVKSLWSRIPSAQRETWLAGEQALLKRWGEPPDALPPRPSPSLQEKLRVDVARLRAGLGSTLPAMPPGAAAELLLESGATVQPRSEFAACLARQWRLRLALEQQGAAREIGLIEWRYASAIDASQWSAGATPGRNTQSGEEDDYPAVARRYLVEGTTLVEAQVDAQGRASSARVVDRKLRVPGLEGMRPVFFETVLDEASVAKIMRITLAKPAPDKLIDGVARQQIELKWKLQ